MELHQGLGHVSLFHNFTIWMFVTYPDTWGFSGSARRCTQGTTQMTHSGIEDQANNTCYGMYIKQQTNINRRFHSVRLNNLSDVYCIQLTCLTTGEEPLCLAVEIGRNARRRRRARRRMLKSWTACSFLPSTDMPTTCFLFGLEATSFSHCKLSSIQTISLGVLFWKYKMILSLWHKRL